MPARLCSISFKLRFSSTWTNVQAAYRKGRASKDQTANIRWIIEKEGGGNLLLTVSQSSLTMLKSLTVDRNKLWNILKVLGIPDHLTCLRETCMQVGKQQLEPDMEKHTGSKLGKEYIKAVYFHPAYLTNMQNASCEMLSWMYHKLESRLPGEITTSDMQMIPL